MGGAGYVGNVLTRRLLGAGHRVRVLDRLIFDHGTALSGIWEEPGFSYVSGDVRSSGDVDRSLDGITDVVLLAGLVGDPICRKYSGLAQEVNDVACRGLIDALNGRGIDRFAFTSTCSNYGLRDSDEPATEESELAPVSLYAEHKVKVEQHVLERLDDLDFTPDAAAHRHGLRALAAHALRPHDLRVHPHARVGRASCSSTTPTPGGPTATSPTSPRRS